MLRHVIHDFTVVPGPLPMDLLAVSAISSSPALMAPIVLLLKTVFEAILEVFLLCLAGYLLACKGILDKKTQKQLNRLNVSLFTPSLLFSKVAFSLSPAKLRELWIIPLFFVLVTIISMGVSYSLGWLFRLKRSQRNFAVAASMFMNSNSLPIALMQSLVVTVPGLKWDEDDTETAMLGRALSYLVLYSTLGMVLRWSYGVHLLSQADPEGSETEGQPQGTQEHERHPEANDQISLLVDLYENVPVPGTESTGTLHDRNRPSSVVFTDADGSPSRDEYDKLRARPRVDPHVFFSFPNTPTHSAVTLQSSSSIAHAPHYNPGDYDSDDDSNSDEPLLLPNTSARRPQINVTTSISSRLQSTMRRSSHRCFHFLKKSLRTINSFMTVPLWAAFSSIIVALVQPLQHILDEHLQPIKGSLSAAGNCSIPLTLVVLGAYFYVPPAEDDATAPKDNSLPRVRVNGDDNVDRDGDRSRSTADDTNRISSRSTSFVGSVRSMLRMYRLDGRGVKQSGDKKIAPRPGETRTVVIAVLSRMVLTPLLLLPLMALGARYDIPKVFDDPVFVLANVLLISSPPALTLAQITQAASGDAFERLISRTIFWAYCVITPPATIIYVVIGLLLAKL
ncbi:hypothetical protein EW145_g4297 [Phellinidium pouzarii]|uniref:Transporter n=1 Tax=Phellinidium pouzarii TaxID=167371 RepID=A0A4S4L4I8_9AGAM|nr:hypothetical protein EW145_g4297 [Phellinidium pouzarii]